MLKTEFENTIAHVCELSLDTYIRNKFRKEYQQKMLAKAILHDLDRVSGDGYPSAVIVCVPDKDGLFIGNPAFETESGRSLLELGIRSWIRVGSDVRVPLIKIPSAMWDSFDVAYHFVYCDTEANGQDKEVVGLVKTILEKAKKVPA